MPAATSDKAGNMSESPTSSRTPPGIERGKKYRFIVKSAEEAISTLRERLGSEAKVLSVRQIDGEGLSRFLNSPKLEIVATIPESSAEPAAPEAPRPGRPAPAKSAPSADPVREELEAELSAGPESAPRSRGNPYAENRAPRRPTANVWTVLRSAGFDDSMLGSLRYDNSYNGPSIDELPLPRALAEVNRRLRMEYQAVESRPVTSRIAFFGTPGVGKTTALCKRLANDVFFGRRSVEVLKLDSDTPNPDDALSLFCDVLSVPLSRDGGGESPAPGADILYADLPGMPLSENEQWMKLRGRLDKLAIDTRVLVVNAMYEQSLVGAAFDLGERMGATHLVITHMDEVVSASRLWTCVLRGRLTPLFASHGQNVTSDYSEDILRVLLEKTFPQAIAG